MENSRKKRRYSSASTEGRLLSALGLDGRNKSKNVHKKSRPASAASRIAFSTPKMTPVGDEPPIIDSTIALPAQQVPDNSSHSKRAESSTSRTTAEEPDEISTPFRHPNNQSRPPSGFRHSLVNPIYERRRPTPSLSSTRASTPTWEMDGEKRVRFMEPEVTATQPARPSSANSIQSNVMSNSSKFAVQNSQYQELFGPIGHSARICNCPCHFFPVVSQNVGIQVAKVDTSTMKMPKLHRLFILPSFDGLTNLPLSSKFTGFMVRCILSQVGLATIIIAWCLLAALFFSTVEGQMEKEQLERMDVYRKNLVIDLATELRQVRPFESIWRELIREYLSKFEDTILEAVRGGYGSTTPSWTFPDSFLYAVSLIALLGPGGLTIQSTITRGFTLVFVIAIAPLMFIVAFNAAQSIREGISYAWAWRRRRKQVSSMTDNINIRNRNFTSEEPFLRPVSGRARIPWMKTSRVFSLDENLSRNRLDSTSSSSPETNVQMAASSSRGLSQNMSSRMLQQNTINNSYTTNNGLNQMSYSSIDPQKTGLPLYTYFIFPLIYISLGILLIILFQNKDVMSALYVTGCHLLNLDHGGIDTKAVFTSGTGAVFYSVFIMAGTISSLTFILSVWPSIYSALGEAGRNLSVVKPLKFYI